MTAREDNRRILCVDDELHVLEGLERSLYDHFDVVTASSGARGLEAICSAGPFAAVVSDMRMPEMDGAAFLARVREVAPDTARLLLTGQADLQSAIAAVNKAHIYRFLCKPCEQKVLMESLEAAVELYRLVTAERELLEQTLRGSVKVLTDVLSLAAPVAFSRANLVRGYVRHMTQRLGLADRWAYEVAAMLATIGCIALPAGTLEKVYARQPISPEERRMLEAHPEIGYRLLANIPRLQHVAEMIRRQKEIVDEPSCSANVRLGARMLRLALDVDRLVAEGMSVRAATREVQKRHGHDLRLLDALDGFQGRAASAKVKAVRVDDLRTAMVLDEDVRARNGSVIVAKGREVNPVLIERLRNFAQGIGVVEPIRVRTPG